MPDYVGAIDQGTTSTRFIVFNRAGQTVAGPERARANLPPTRMGRAQSCRKSGRTRRSDREPCNRKGLPASDLAAMGITNQRETTVVWNRKTGKPVYNALVWQDTRVGDDVGELARSGGQDRFRAKTGLAACNLFQRSENPLDPGKRPRSAERWPSLVNVLFGNIDTFLALEPDRRHERWHSRHRCDQRQPNSADESRNLWPGTTRF